MTLALPPPPKKRTGFKAQKQGCHVRSHPSLQTLHVKRKHAFTNTEDDEAACAGLTMVVQAPSL